MRYSRPPIMKSYIVDAFTKQAFKGNPAGVCLVEASLTDELMLSIAQEFNLSETAFIQKTNINTYSIRYFSPKIEIPLCGHATLASAKVVFESDELDQVHFITAAKLDLVVKKREDELAMEFPLYSTEPSTVPPAMLHALGLTEVIKIRYNTDLGIFILEIADAEQLASLHPNYMALLQSYHSINGVLVTASSNDLEYDFHYRYFWPWSGTNEDPVTGGVQTFLAKYWSDKIGKTKMKAFQSSQRGGYMNLDLVGNKVIIQSQAVIVFEGDFKAH
jgi:PhzF family phenazine biosynthesis protein